MIMEEKHFCRNCDKYTIHKEIKKVMYCTVCEPEIPNKFRMEKYQLWYKIKEVKNALVYQLMYREGAVLGERKRVRNMKIREVSHLQENIKKFRILEEPVNWYYSVAVLKTMPIFSFNPVQRKIESKQFIQTFNLFMDGFDLPLDFDSKHVEFETTLSDMRKVHKWMQVNNIPHVVRASGAGFHILVYSNYLWQKPFHFRPSLSPLLCWVVVCALKRELKLKSLDTSVVDFRRIWKVPYSMDIKTGNICRPLNDYEIDHFNFEMLSMEYCINHRGVFKRSMFVGNSRGLNKFIFSLFADKCKTSMKIWKYLERILEENEGDRRKILEDLFGGE